MKEVRAKALSGELIGSLISFTDHHGERLKEVELRQVYHTGGETVINVIRDHTEQLAAELDKKKIYWEISGSLGGGEYIMTEHGLNQDFQVEVTE